ncbi:hypothetical protein FKV73_07675 [Weissella paramesenteroides]|nr:hypothetical protein FKV79_04135 [Weissella paramesenteroides]KAA8436666.1 hypothetical protein FKV73_07675 [Weissella paramesenteroides]
MMIENNFDLTNCLANLTSDPKATTKILKYIDTQHGAKNRKVLHNELGKVINTKLSTEDGDNILACILSYSEHYHDKIIELIAS